MCAEDGQVFAWGYPAHGRLGNFFDTGSKQVGRSVWPKTMIEDGRVPMNSEDWYAQWHVDET